MNLTRGKSAYPPHDVKSMPSSLVARPEHASSKLSSVQGRSRKRMHSTMDVISTAPTCYRSLAVTNKTTTRSTLNSSLFTKFTNVAFGLLGMIPRGIVEDFKCFKSRCNVSPATTSVVTSCWQYQLHVWRPYEALRSWATPTLSLRIYASDHIYIPHTLQLQILQFVICILKQSPKRRVNLFRQITRLQASSLLRESQPRTLLSDTISKHPKHERYYSLSSKNFQQKPPMSTTQQHQAPHHDPKSYPNTPFSTPKT